MAKGIVYVTTSEIEGLVKIGKTQNLESRIKDLSTNGYLRQKCDMVYAIEVDDYSEKEDLLHTIFGKGRAGKTEFFAENVDLVVQTLSAFEGKQVFPKESYSSKEESFKQATDAVKSSLLPDGEYHLEVKSQATKHVCKGYLKVEEGKMLLKHGSVISIDFTRKGISAGWINLRNSLNIDSAHVLIDDVLCKSVSQAAFLVIGTSKNGWEVWQDAAGDIIEKYKIKDKEE